MTSQQCPALTTITDTSTSLPSRILASRTAAATVAATSGGEVTSLGHAALIN